LKDREEKRKAKQAFQISLMIVIMMLTVLFNQVRRILGFFFDANVVSSVFFFYDPWIPIVQVVTASMSIFLCLLNHK
jgi:hypothetical protein